MGAIEQAKIKAARDVVPTIGNDGFDELIGNIEAALGALADEHGVVLDGESVEKVQAHICENIARRYENGGAEAVDIHRLVREMEDPESDKAKQNVAIAASMESSDSLDDPLYRLSNEILKEKYS